jgi:hypothetical protein
MMSKVFEIFFWPHGKRFFVLVKNLIHPLNKKNRIHAHLLRTTFLFLNNLGKKILFHILNLKLEISPGRHQDLNLVWNFTPNDFYHSTVSPLSQTTFLKWRYLWISFLLCTSVIFWVRSKAMLIIHFYNGLPLMCRPLQFNLFSFSIKSVRVKHCFWNICP